MVLVATSTHGPRVADLINQTTEWGLSVSEAAAKRTLKMQGMALAGYLGFVLASLLVIPILAGVLFFTVSNGFFLEIGVILAIAAFAKYLDVQSRKGPKNALQIDYSASQVRLGSINTAGAFVRHKVCPLSAISTVSIDTSDPDAPALVLEMFAETAKIRFTNTSADALAELAASIQTAADEARAAPIHSRIVSRINGLEAGVREISRRVVSRVNSSFA